MGKISRFLGISLCLLFFSFSISSQTTMTFDGGASYPGFSFSGWNSLSGVIFPASNQPNVNGSMSISKNEYCFNLISFKTTRFDNDNGGGQWRVVSNNDDVYYFCPNSQSVKIHTLNWKDVSSITFFVDPGSPDDGCSVGLGSNATFDFDDLVFEEVIKTPATTPTVSISPSSICPGQSATLMISGSLNDAVSWNVYASNCGSSLIGNTSGNSFVVQPSSSTTYYVRGEGDACTPLGSCASTSITVLSTSTSLNNIQASPSSTCPGDAVSLTASGGTNGTGATIKWYTGPNGTGINFATGAGPHTVNPEQTTSYYVRREGTCNTTNDASVLVTVQVCDPCAALGGDSDGDGVCNDNDGCPLDVNKVSPGACGCGVVDIDTDGDGTADCLDFCPFDPDKIAPGICGCGESDVDSDGDGTADCKDDCPLDVNKIAPGICGCGVEDVDSDGDGTADCFDECPSDPDKIVPGICGCGESDVDSDGDGTADCKDECPLDVNKITPGICGCGVEDVDSDGDGTPDCFDECPSDPDKIVPGICGCGESDVDTDRDGTADCLDECPSDPDKIVQGICGCGVSDIDSDGDGTADCLDECPSDPDKIVQGICGCGVSDIDSDGDGTADCFDNCPSDPNKIFPGQCGCGFSDLDTDSDGLSDCVDLDDDNDGQSDLDEITCGSDPLDNTDLSSDNDNDNSPDCVDPDDDNDGIIDDLDNCPFDANSTQEDGDSDGIGDVCDPTFDLDVAVDNAVTIIEDYLDLNKGQENALGGQIEDVLDKYCNGNLTEALNKLNAFSNHVQAFLNAGIITEEEADELMEIVVILMDAITDPNQSISCGSGLRSEPEIQFQEIEFRVYPNPASQFILIELNEPSTDRTLVNIYNHLGQLILSNQIPSGSDFKKIEIDQNQFSNGVYFVNLISETQKSVKKIIVNR